MATKDGSSFRLSATPVTIFAHLLAIAITVLVLIWILHFQDGLAFNSDYKTKIFNMHPTLMVIGFILLGGEAIMAHKTIPAIGNKKIPKLIHLILNLIALVAGIIGIYAVFKYHKESGIDDMYSLHSWFGISTISLFGLQFLLGFFSFFFPGATTSSRERFLPWHWLFGMTIFLMAIVSAETGLMERFWLLVYGKGLDLHGREALIMNFTGLLLLLFAVSVSLSVILPKKN